MEIMSKYYKELKNATNQLEEMQRNYTAYGEFSEFLINQLNELSNRGNLSVDGYKENTYEMRKKKKGQLGIDFTLTGLLVFVFSFGLCASLFSLPMYIILALLLVICANFAILHVEQLRKLNKMGEYIDKAKCLIKEIPEGDNIEKLIEELRKENNKRQGDINELQEAINEYITLLLIVEDRSPMYECPLVDNNDIAALEEGFKKLEMKMHKGDLNE